MLTSQERFQAIHGLLLGMAVGEALGLPLKGLSTQCIMRVLRRHPLSYRLWPGQGLFGDQTELALMAGQAILQSKSVSESCHRRFLSRLRWYVLGGPSGANRVTYAAGLKSWFRRTGLPTGCWSATDAPASRSLVFGVVLHNTGHRFLVWARDSSAATDRHPLAADGAGVWATAAQIAAIAATERLDPLAALDTIIKASREPAMEQALTQLQPFLQRRSSARDVARHFGWQRGISGHILPTTVMAVYCFLRHPNNYRHALKSALMLGGNTDGVAAIVGGLVGAHIGAQALPRQLVEGLSDWPQDRRWIERLAIRLSDWPHGVDDLLLAPPLPAHPVGLLLRNLFRWPLVLTHAVARIPSRLAGLT
jgi:ADP-ribosylglycohydrolase